MQKSEKTVRAGVLLFPRFSNHCLANAIEPLRAFNDIAKRKAFDWEYLTLDGQPVCSSSGLPVTPHGALRDSRGGEILLVLPSYGFREIAAGGTGRALRSAARRFEILAGLDAGSWLLADAGLLDRRQATIHWQEIESFAETFPEVDVQRRRVLRDGNRWSCAGASTAFDLSLTLIREAHGALAALEVEAFLMHGASGAGDPEIGAPVGAPTRHPVVSATIAIMRENLEDPLPLPKLAAQVGLSLDQLAARFRRELRRTPGSVYRQLRLGAARRYVEQSDLGIAEIAVRCGYADPAAMTRAFRKQFGVAPSVLRAQDGFDPARDSRAEIVTKEERWP